MKVIRHRGEAAGVKERGSGSRSADAVLMKPLQHKPLNGCGSWALSERKVAERSDAPFCLLEYLSELTESSHSFQQLLHRCICLLLCYF